MSVAGLIHLMEMAKKGANFGKLSSQHLEIGNISDAEIDVAQVDIAAFLSTCAPAKSAQDEGKKANYLVNRYAGQYLWLYDNFTKNSPMYNIPIAKEIIGTFEPERLISALKKMLKRHAALCGHYQLDGENIAVDIVSPDTTMFERCLEDINTLDDEAQQNSVMAAMEAQCSVPFNLGSELPLRCHILRKNAQHHYLFLTFHHSVVDGWTANLLVDELTRDYCSDEEHRPQYDDSHAFFRFLEDPFLSVANANDSLEFWLDELRYAPEKHTLDYDIAITAADKAQNIVRESLAGDLQQALAQQAKCAGTSLFALLHTAFALLIARESASERVVIGSPVANRTEPALNAAVGSFVNTVAHQFHIAADDNFSTLLQKSAGKFARAFKHQGLPFSYLVEQLKPARGKFHPIFQIMFVCQHRKNNELIFGSAQVDTLSRKYAPPKFDLVLEVISTVDGIQFEWQYNAKLFAPQRIKALSQTYMLLLEQIVRDPLLAVGRYSLTPTADIAQLRKLSTGAEIPEFLHQNLSQRLWRAGNEHAALPALIEGERVWSYEKLLHHAGTVAHWLAVHTVQEALIAIDLPRGALQAIVALGILLAGRAYLPLAEGLPDARAADVIRLSGCDWVINTASHQHPRYPFGTHCQALDAIFSTSHLRDEFHFTQGKAHDLAYVIYTSGTTGTPKGVAIEHSAITNTLLTMNRLFHVSPRDNILAIADLAFDLSVYDLFGSWLAGATVISLSAQDAKEPASWLNTIRQHQISIWNSVPAMLQMLLQYCEQENIASLPELRQIWLSGDRISPRLIAQAYRLCPNASITSLGGATEGAIWSIYHPLSRDTQYRNAIPYGVALPNQNMWVLDEDLKPCGYGVTGDIYIGGTGVAREYWHDRQTTAGSFIACSELGGRLYRTGDRGRWNRCDYIEFLGREDQQVKLQGFRVELGDIEFVLKNNALVAEACVVCCNDPDSGARHLEAYITLTSEGKSSAQAEVQLREHVSTALPAYMTPTRYHVIEHFPLSRNGKLDRSLLFSNDTPLQAQRNPIPQTFTAELLHLQMLLAETLGCEPNQIDPHASFFGNGGSSLSGITFLGKIKHALNVELTLAEILGYQQLTSLAKRIRQNPPLALSVLSEQVNNPSLPTLYLVHGAGGQVHQYARLVEKLSPYANIITIACPELAGPGDSVSVTLPQLAAAHLTVIAKNKRTSAMIAGWSLGGQLAIHMAALATQQGKPFAHAVVIDSGLPSSDPLNKRQFSVTQCYLNLFDSLGIAQQLYQHGKMAPQCNFIDEVREHYASNQSVLAEKITIEHAEAFCLAIKKSFELTDSAGELPQLDIPLALCLSQERLCKQADLSSRWKAQSSQNVRLTYCAETHYSIIDSTPLHNALRSLLCELKCLTKQSRYSPHQILND
ncbi:non-ribosomal peptide synthetase [Serratia sp. 2723]|uniref:non-ribosomal peptide synthetase n=1 Tax=unclassified Serratia (in: enterobacteria) TaxID=2647522 RepID=UPI003D1B0C50